MEQFRHIGEVVGGLKALMVLKHDIQVNQKQCCLLLDLYVLAFETISDEIKENLRLDERGTKWKALESPMRELHKIIKEGELYIKYCLDIKDWWAKAVSLHSNRDCVEFHIHNLLCCFPVVIEAIETAAEISGLDEGVMMKRRFALMKKYDAQCSDPNLFQWMFGKQYLVPRDILSKLDNAWKEDRWSLVETIREKRNAAASNSSLGKHEQRLGDLLLKKLSGSEPAASTKLLPSAAILVGSSDYYVKRRLGSGGSHIKEIQWLGESFALRNFFGEVEPIVPEISLVLSISHPNIMQYFCGFYDEERKEGFLVMELMSKSLDTHVKENCGQRKRVPFSLPVTVDIMLQIARGMEYLHSRCIYHGELNPSHILLKQRGSSPEGYFLAKITGVSLNTIKSFSRRTSPSSKGNGVDPIMWYAPEVLAEQEHSPGSNSSAKYTEKADVYSFGMLCFQLLTGKVPFEDAHLIGEKMVRNIRAGERPLFPCPSPKYLANLTRKCWQSNPSLRPSFSAICRILRYIKKNLIINPDYGQPESLPPFVDYCDIEAGYAKKFPGEVGSPYSVPVSQIPFQLFAYRLVEEEKISGSSKLRTWDIGNEGPSVHKALSLCDAEHLAVMDDLFGPSDRRSVCSEIIERKYPFFADQRSVISETPQNKLFDQLSIGSESPGRRFPRSVGGLTPELTKKLASRKAAAAAAADASSACSATPEKVALSTTTNQKKLSIKIPVMEVFQAVASPRTPEAKLLTPTVEQSPRITEVPDEKPSMTAQEPIASHTPAKKKHTSKMGSSIRRLSDIPEKESIAKGTLRKQKSIPSPAMKVKPVSRENPVKNTSSANKTSAKSGPVKTSEKKILLKGKQYGQETSKNSPASSPARALKETPWSSPTRGLIEISSSPKHPSTFTSKGGFSSPRQSPLHPCARPSPRQSPFHPCIRPSARQSPLHPCAQPSPRQSPLHPCARPFPSPLHPCARCAGHEPQFPAAASPLRQITDQGSDDAEFTWAT